MLGQESVGVCSEMLANHLRHSRRQHDAEAVFGNVPTHHVFRLGIKHRARRNDLRTREALGEGRRQTSFRAGNQYRRRAIPE